MRYQWKEKAICVTYIYIYERIKAETICGSSQDQTKVSKLLKYCFFLGRGELHTHDKGRSAEPGSTSATQWALTTDSLGSK